MKKGLFLLVIVMLLVTSFSALAVTQNNNSGLPDRIGIVEKVLEVEKMTKQPTMEVLGTDYLIGDEGKLQSYLKVGEFPIDNASCFVSVLYPNMTYFLENQMMNGVGLEYFSGLYFYDFIVPEQTGVYPVNSYCFYDSTHQHYIPHVYSGNFTFLNGYLDDLFTDDFDSGLLFGGGFFANQTLLFEQYDPEQGLHLQDTNNSLVDDDDEFATALDVTSIITDNNLGTVVTLDGSTAGMGTLNQLLNAPFDETTGNISFDVSSNGNDGQIFGNPNLTVTGLKNTGYGFDGINDYVIFPNSTEYIIADGDEFMLCVGINTKGSVNDNDRIVSMRGFDNNDGWYLDDSAGNHIKWQVDYSGSGQKTIESLSTFSTDEMRSVCVYSNNTGEGIYVDGVFDIHKDDVNTGALGTVLEPIFAGSKAGTSSFWEGTADEICVISGATINKSFVAERYNKSRSCSGLFNNYPLQGLKTTFDLTSDGISTYDLRVYSPDDGINYTLFAYLDANSIETDNNLTFTTNGTGTYELDVTNLVDDMTFIHGLPNITFRLVNDELGLISEIELDRTITNFTGISTCQGNICSIIFDYEFPIGFNDEFLTDSRIFFRVSETGNNLFNISFFDYVNSSWEVVDTLSGVDNITFAVQIPYFERHIQNNSVSVSFSTYDFLEGETIFIEQLEAVNTYNGSYVYSLRGNDELVVSQGLQNLTVTVAGLENAQINILPDIQLGQIVVILIFLVLLFTGYLIPASILGLMYSFIYLDGLLTAVGLGVSVIILYGGNQLRKKQR